VYAGADACGVAPSLAAHVLSLDDPAASDPTYTGAKAANLARAAAAGVPVLPGVVVSTAAALNGRLDDADLLALRTSWDRLVARHPGTYVVRSSSTVEDIGSSSMAGQFTSVLGVGTWIELVEAVQRVLASAARPRDLTTDARPMAVLIQPELRPVTGGVLFGVDPVSGDTKRLGVDVAAEGPDAVVSGRVAAAHLVLDRRGRVRSGSDTATSLLPRGHRRELVALADRVGRLFGGPQDVEWAYDEQGRLWLLQSRPITALAGRVGTGPLLGPGPVSETFPEPLRPLEVELWVEPLRAGIRRALAVTGSTGRRHLERSPIVVVVGGRVAADLELLGVTTRRRTGWQILNPVGPTRKLVAAWGVGRLRAALPALTEDLIRAVDEELSALPPLGGTSDADLLEVLDAARTDLRSLHGYEVLAGTLLGREPTATGIGLAVAALQRRRPAGDDDAVVAHSPIVLALLPPAILRPRKLPAVSGSPTTSAGVHDLPPREALRLRCRWLQELTARVVEELAARLVATDRLPTADDVVHLSLSELQDLIDGGDPPTDLETRRAWQPGPPLPVRFQLGADASPVATGPGGADGVPGGGRRATGMVRHQGTPAAPGRRDVLVVDTLDPRLAAELGDLAGLVSESGSPLSHLAILARERGVAIVVAVPDARRRFPEGCEVLIDGATGQVERLSREVDA
jgi:phosphohistidine swiveling domain-containing protein